MQTRILALSLFLAGLAQPALAQEPVTSRAESGSSERLAVATARHAAAPARLACAPLVGQVFDPNGKPLKGATLLIKGSHEVYVTV